MHKLFYGYMLCIGLFFPFRVYSQTYGGDSCNAVACGCSDILSPAGVMISHVHQKNEWMLSYRYNSIDMSGVLQGTHPLDKAAVLTSYLAFPEVMIMQMHMLMLMYGLTDRLTVMMMLNYNNNYMEMASGKHHHSTQSSGPGDTKLSLIYALIKKPKNQLLLSGGLSLPTGNVFYKGKPESTKYPNHRLPYNMQLGSGAADVSPGINYLFQKNKTTFSRQLIGTLRLYNNAVGYRLGNETLANVWMAYNWINSLNTSVRIEGSYIGKIKGSDTTLPRDTEIAANPLNYGGTKLTGFIGSTIRFHNTFLNRVKFGFEYGIPFYQNLNGMQMQTNNTLYASFSLNL